MNNLVRSVKRHFPYTINAIARFFTRNQPKILMYHRFSALPETGKVDASVFELQLKEIKQSYRPVTVSQLAHELFVEKRPRSNTVALTIDDGYADFYEYAFPLLKMYDIPATFYVTTNFIDDANWLWPDKVLWLLRNAPENASRISHNNTEIIKRSFERNSIDLIWHQVVAYILTIPNREKDEFIDHIQSAWELSLPIHPPSEFSSCSEEQLLEMQEHGVEIGGHTVNHPSLGKTTLEESRREIIECEQWLREKLGEQKRSFCFPNGQPDDYTQGVINLLKNESQFTCAVTAFSDAQALKHQFALRRHCGSHDINTFNSIISGVEHLGHKVRRTTEKVD